MRSITSKAQEAKRNKRNQYILGGILIFVMFISVVGYGFQSSDDTTDSSTFEYNSYTFIPQNGIWYLQLGDFVLSFKYTPDQTTTIDSVLNPLSSYANNPLYLSSKTPEADYEISRNFDQVVLRRQYACLEGEECANPTYPVKTCADNVILIQEAEVMNISQRDNCVFIQGPKEDLTRITDEFLYKVIGIK